MEPTGPEEASRERSWKGARERDGHRGEIAGPPRRRGRVHSGCAGQARRADLFAGCGARSDVQPCGLLPKRSLADEKRERGREGG